MGLEETISFNFFSFYIVYCDSMAVKDNKASGKSESNNTSNISDIKSLIEFFYIKYVPSYGNSFFFTIGIYLPDKISWQRNSKSKFQED